MASSLGYKCEFISCVSEDFYCKKCTLVARRLTLTSCCGESFCQTCIADTQEQGQPCPECGEKEFTTLEHLRSQKRIFGLPVYCNTKERGCVWSGTLEQLDTHLDPHLDNCQYVDTKCPQNCLQTIPKNKVDHHVAQECTKRPHVCQHCAFKATYEEVVDTHLPECKYVPLQCPNMCGVSCEREIMEDHMKICRLEEVECEFSSVGCDGRFMREGQDKHARQNSQKHLTLTASLATIMNEEFQHKIKWLDNKVKEQGNLLEEQNKTLKLQVRKIGEQEKKLGDQEKKLGGQEKKLGEQEKKLGEQEKKLGEQEKKLREQEKKLGERDEEMIELKQLLQKVVAKSELNQQTTLNLFRLAGLNRKFEMRNFSKEKAKDKYHDWKSPAMYTHLGGYKFCIGVDANGYGIYRNKFITLSLWSMCGEFDGQLKWPVHIELTVELLNQRGGNNSMHIFTPKKVNNAVDTILFSRFCSSIIKHSELSNFLLNDTLYFSVSGVKFVTH